MRQVALVVFIVLLLGSCSGKIVTKYHGSTLNFSECQGDPDSTSSGQEETTQCVEGVPFRATGSRMEYFTYTTHPTEQKCTFQLLSRIVHNVPGDWYTIAYKPAKFEQHKFSVTLNPNGTLSSVNAESTPVTPETLVEAVVKGAAPAMLTRSHEDCTDTPTVLGRCKMMENSSADASCANTMLDRLENYKKLRNRK